VLTAVELTNLRRSFVPLPNSQTTLARPALPDRALVAALPEPPQIPQDGERRLGPSGDDPLAQDQIVSLTGGSRSRGPPSAALCCPSCGCPLTGLAIAVDPASRLRRRYADAPTAASKYCAPLTLRKFALPCCGACGPQAVKATLPMEGRKASAVALATLQPSPPAAFRPVTACPRLVGYSPVCMAQTANQRKARVARRDTIEIGGKAYSWQAIRQLRQEQIAARKASEAEQLTLFELRHDCRPSAERDAKDRYEQPSLFGLMGPAEPARC
jgi:hypothetical protein